jgi:hypothetical protein
MRVTITQRGGYVGDEVTVVDVDTTRLDGAQRKALEREVEAASTASRPRGAAIGADHMMEYSLVVEDKGQRRAISLIDDGSSSAKPIRDLIAKLQQVP